MQNRAANNGEKTLIQELITLRNKSQSACENDSVAHLLGNSHLRGIMNNDVCRRGKQIFVNKQPRSRFSLIKGDWRKGTDQFGFKADRFAGGNRGYLN